MSLVSFRSKNALYTKVVSTTLVCSMVFTSCGAPLISGAKVQQIIGTDDRVEDNSEISQRSVGSLNMLGEYRCTAFATGAHQITTAYHCIANQDKHITDGAFSFTTKTASYKITSVERVIEKADYAVLNVDNEIPQWLDVADYDPNSSLSIYSATENGKIYTNTIKQTMGIIANGYVKYTLDSVPGASGSPVLQKGKVIAVHLGSLKSSNIGILVNKANDVDEKKFNKEMTLQQLAYLATIVAGVSTAISLGHIINKDNREILDKKISDSRKLREPYSTSRVENPAFFPGHWGHSDVIYQVDSEHAGSGTYVNLSRGEVVVTGYVDRTTCKEAVDKAAAKADRENKSYERANVERAKCDCAEKAAPVRPTGGAEQVTCSTYKPIWTNIENTKAEYSLSGDRNRIEESGFKIGLPPEPSENFYTELHSKIASAGLNALQADQAKNIGFWLFDVFSRTDNRIVIDASTVINIINTNIDKSLAEIGTAIWQQNFDAQGFGYLVEGQLSNISAASDGTIWGVNINNDIFRRVNNAWEQMPGKLAQISVGSAANIWGVNSSGQAFRWTGSSWCFILGELKNVSAAADGSILGVNSNEDIFRWAGNSWLRLSGKLTQISAGSSDIIWGINSGGFVFSYKL